MLAVTGSEMALMRQSWKWALKDPGDCGEKHSEGQCMEKCQGNF